MSSIQIIIVVIAVVLTLGIVTCVVSHYKMGARSWNERWNRPSQQPFQQTHHQQGDFHSSRVLYMTTPSQERMQRENASFQDRQTRIKSVQVDMELNLPPRIALPDGEEQPYDSLQHLHLRNADQESEIYRECVYAPPNRTVFEGESPPPYRSSVLHSQQVSSSGTPSSVAAARGVRDWNGTPLVKRGHSRSHNNNTTPPHNGNNSNSSSRSHSPHLPQVHPHPPQPNPPLPTHAMGQEPRLSACPPEGEPPPGYSEVLANPKIYGSLHPNSGV